MKRLEIVQREEGCLGAGEGSKVCTPNSKRIMEVRSLMQANPHLLVFG